MFVAPARQRASHQPRPSQRRAVCVATAADQGPQRRAHAKKANACPAWPHGRDDPKKPWTELTFDQFGLHATLAVKTQQALYYKPGGQRLLTIVLTRDLQGGRPDQMFYCTNLDWDVRQVLATYAYRWAIECTFENCKQFLGLEDPANRLPKAVARTAPMALFLYSILITWFHRVGHAWVQFPKRPWYPSKREPSFADVLTTLRRVSGGKNRTSGAETVSLENLAYATDRVFQPRGITAAVSDSLTSIAFATLVEGRRLIAKLRTEICETRTKSWRRETTSGSVATNRTFFSNPLRRKQMQLAESKKCQ